MKPKVVMKRSSLDRPSAALRVSRVHQPVTVLGPGRRLGLWLQGCSIQCRGCVSRDTWDPAGGELFNADRLAELVVEGLDAGLDGVTISGGEPFDQPEGLACLLGLLRPELDRRRADLLVYSGYSLGYLQRHYERILARADAVITGPFRDDLPTSLIWRGSSNQRLDPITETGAARYAPFQDYVQENPSVQLSVNGGIWMVGIPRRGDLDLVAAALDKQGVTMEGASWKA